MPKFQYIFIIAFSIAVSGCGGGSSNNSEPDTTGSRPLSDNTTNIAILAGETVGIGSNSITDLRKIVTLGLVLDNPDFTVGEAYIVRYNRTATDLAYWVMEITNISNSLHCFIRAEGIEYLDSNNQNLATVDYTYVLGRLAVSQLSNISTNTCLNPGEMGYLFGISINQVSTFYDDIAKMQINSISTSSSKFTDSTISILPQGYNKVDNAIYPVAFDVQVKNTSTNNGILDTYSEYIILDESDKPLFWGYMTTPNSADVPINAGLSFTLNAESIYRGTFNKVYVNLTFSELISASLIGAQQYQTITKESANILESDDPVTIQKKLLDERNRLNQNKSYFY